MTQVKFSQFENVGSPASGDQFAGLRNGTNSLFDFGGSFSNVLSNTIILASHGFLKGEILAINSSGNYIAARANSAANANVVGIITSVIDINTFILLIGGYITTLEALDPGTVYFLSSAVEGQASPTPPIAVGTIVKPLYIADSTTTSAYWLNYNGQQI